MISAEIVDDIAGDCNIMKFHWIYEYAMPNMRSIANRKNCNPHCDSHWQCELNSRQAPVCNRVESVRIPLKYMLRNSERMRLEILTWNALLGRATRFNQFKNEAVFVSSNKRASQRIALNDNRFIKRLSSAYRYDEISPSNDKWTA